MDSPLSLFTISALIVCSLESKDAIWQRDRVLKGLVCAILLKYH